MVDSWDQFFHSPSDPATLAVFRIVFGLVMLADALSWGRSSRLLLDPDSLIPWSAWLARGGATHLSVLRWLPVTRTAVRIVIGLYAFASICVAAGLFTRASAALAFVCVTSINHRNRLVLHSGDALLRCLCFLLIFSEAGRAWSVDALFRPDSGMGSSWALRLMQLQVAAVYGHTVVWKLMGATWRNGTAAFYASRLLTHQKRAVVPGLDKAALYRVGTYGVLAVEAGTATLVWLPSTRYWVLGSAIMLHLALQRLMRMHLFQFTMLTSLILFLPPADIRRFLALLLDVSGA